MITKEQVIKRLLELPVEIEGEKVELYDSAEDCEFQYQGWNNTKDAGDYVLPDECIVAKSKMKSHERKLSKLLDEQTNLRLILQYGFDSSGITGYRVDAPKGWECVEAGDTDGKKEVPHMGEGPGRE